jgi:hypothetical protein
MAGRDDYYRNPHGTVPSPGPSAPMPTAFWRSKKFPVQWTGLAGGQDQALWKTPVFDYRPDLRSADGVQKMGVPVWDSSARLYVMLSGLIVTLANTEDLFLEYREYAHPLEARAFTPQPARAVAPVGGGFPAQVANQSVVPVTTWVDATSEIMQTGRNPQPNAVVMVFEPIGSGYPVRYWQIELRFQKLIVAGGDISLQAAVY